MNSFKAKRRNHTIAGVFLLLSGCLFLFFLIKLEWPIQPKFVLFFLGILCFITALILLSESFIDWQAIPEKILEFNGLVFDDSDIINLPRTWQPLKEEEINYVNKNY